MKAAPRESEAGFTRAVLDLAKLHGWRAMHQRPAMTAKGWRTAISGDAGFPDLVLVRGTRLIFAELKSATGKVAPAQTEWLIRLMGAGAECYIWKPKDWPEIVAKLSPACDGSAAVKVSTIGASHGEELGKQRSHDHYNAGPVRRRTRARTGGNLPGVVVRAVKAGYASELPADKRKLGHPALSGGVFPLPESGFTDGRASHLIIQDRPQ